MQRCCWSPDIETRLDLLPLYVILAMSSDSLGKRRERWYVASECGCLTAENEESSTSHQEKRKLRRQVASLNSEIPPHDIIRDCWIAPRVTQLTGCPWPSVFFFPQGILTPRRAIPLYTGHRGNCRCFGRILFGIVRAERSMISFHAILAWLFVVTL